MTAVMERANAAPEPSPYERMHGIAAAPAIAEQWRRFDAVLQTPPEQREELYRATLDFAADPTSSTSTIIRLRALEIGLSILRHSDPEQLSPAMQADNVRFEQVLPAYFTSDTRPATSSDHLQQVSEAALNANDATIARLARDEQFPIKGLFHTIEGFSFDSTRNHLVSPGLATIPRMLLEQTAAFDPQGHRYEYATVPPKLQKELISGALEWLPAAVRQGAAMPLSLQRTSEFVRLSRYGDGFMMSGHEQKVQELADLGGSEPLAYARVMNELYDDASILEAALPVFSGIAKAERSLLGNLPFVVVHHLQHGRVTDEQIALHNMFRLPARFKGREPLDLLEQLDEAHHILGEHIAPDAYTVLSIDKSEYRIHRFVRGLTSAVAGYVRPCGGYSYDTPYEHGRPTEGVEGSVSINIDTTRKIGLIGLKKKERGAGVISIRVDLEARPDPCAAKAQMALDLGSVLGSEKVFGVKVGRLIALANRLRYEARGWQPTLNHLRINSTAQKDEPTNAVFAGLAIRQEGLWQARRRGATFIRRQFRDLTGQAVQ
jgi:hypothetical protein